MRRPPRSIRIFLPDGSATGIRHAEVANWSGQALVCPRSLLGQLKDWPEAKRPGVYWLFGDGSSSRPAGYVGEAEDVLKRLANHLRDKDFWREVVLFTSKDANLTKAHIKYLEARFFSLAADAGRYELVNGNAPSGAQLPRADAAAMDEFLDHAKLLMAALGHRPLESIEGSSEGQESAASSPLFHLHYRNLEAQARLTEDGLTVLAGSQGRLETRSSLQPGAAALRHKLIEDGVIEAVNDRLIVRRAYAFSSPSAAGCVLTGGRVNGRKLWRTAEGVTLGDWQEQVAQDIESAVDQDQDAT